MIVQKAIDILLKNINIEFDGLMEHNYLDFNRRRCPIWNSIDHRIEFITYVSISYEGIELVNIDKYISQKQLWDIYGRLLLIKNSYFENESINVTEEELQINSNRMLTAYDTQQIIYNELSNIDVINTSNYKKGKLLMSNLTNKFLDVNSLLSVDQYITSITNSIMRFIELPIIDFTINPIDDSFIYNKLKESLQYKIPIYPRCIKLRQLDNIINEL